jgi:hypothetical protein
MTSFTERDRKFIIKLARKLQLLEGDVKSLKKSQGKTPNPVDFAQPQEPTMDSFNVVFSSDVDWTQEEKEFALKSLYQAIRALCEDTGIVKLNLSINIPKEGL